MMISECITSPSTLYFIPILLRIWRMIHLYYLIGLVNQEFFVFFHTLPKIKSDIWATTGWQMGICMVYNTTRGPNLVWILPESIFFTLESHDLTQWHIQWYYKYFWGSGQVEPVIVELLLKVWVSSKSGIVNTPAVLSRSSQRDVVDLQPGASKGHVV